MATRDSSGVERRRVPPSAERDECPKDSDALDSDVLGRLSRTLTGWPTKGARVDGQERIGGEL